jgi:hypothetical protein
VPPLVPGPAGFATIATVEQLRAVIDGAPPLGNLSLYLPPGSILQLDGTPIAVGSINLQLSSDGEGATIDAGHRSQMFRLTSGARLRVHALTLANGHSAGLGGVAFVAATVRVDFSSCRIANSSSMHGGAMVVTGGSVTVSDGSTIANSTAGLVRLSWCCRVCAGVGVGWELVGRVSDMLGVRCGEAVVSRGGMEFG